MINTAVLQKPPVSGSIVEQYYDAHGACTFVRFEIDIDEKWVGVFGKGFLPTHSCAVPFSDGTCNIFVIAGGQGYIVDANTRLLLHKTESEILVSCIAVPSKDFVIVSDFTEIFAVSVEGILWNSGRVAMDGIDLQNSTKDELTGRVWNRYWYDFTLRFRDWDFQQTV